MRLVGKERQEGLLQELHLLQPKANEALGAEGGNDCRVITCWWGGMK